jgi:hypothetical protein
MYENEIKSLLESCKKRFQKWDEEKKLVPRKPGVYIVWNVNQFLYSGIAQKNDGGLYRRLNKHAMGQRGGDQFCCRVCDAFIVPDLDKDQIDKLQKGINIFDGKDGLIRNYIRKNLAYQFYETKDTKTAREIEEILRTGASPLGPPFLNPKKPIVIVLKV